MWQPFVKSKVKFDGLKELAANERITFFIRIKFVNL